MTIALPETMALETRRSELPGAMPSNGWLPTPETERWQAIYYFGKSRIVVRIFLHPVADYRFLRRVCTGRSSAW